MQRVTTLSVLSAVLLAAGLLIAEDPQPPSPTAEALDLGIEEYTERRLAQIDVAVTGPPEVIGQLTAADFELFVGNIVLGGKAFEPLFADRICPAVQALDDLPATAPDARGDVSPRFRYVFFFDQPHLTFVGRTRALALARELVDGLVTGGSSATIVSTDRQLATYARDTEDPEELFRALDELERDPRQTSSFGENMENRLRQIYRWRLRFAQNLAYQFQKEEIVEASRSMRRLSMVLRSQAEFDPPKVLFYFADTMISRPGQIYIQLANRGANFIAQGARNQLSTGSVDPWAAGEPFVAAILDAAAAGVRLFPIQAEGLVQKRYRTSARHSLAGMAKKTGGVHFINGVAPSVIVNRLHEKLDCLYLLSFDPAGLPEDQRHGVIVNVKHPEVRANARSLFLLRDSEGGQEAELEAAFTAPDTAEFRRSLSGVLIPIGFVDGKYAALLQMRVPGSPSVDTVWDHGYAILWRDAVRASVEGRINVARGSSSVVLESVVDLSLSDFEVMLVAQEQASESVLTGHLTDRWPDPRDTPLSISPIQAAQPADAYFVRDEQTRSGGLLGVAEGASIQPDRSVTMLALVCRDSKARAVTLRVVHHLSGGLNLRLPPTSLDLPQGQRCGLVRESIPAGQLSSGALDYTITATNLEGQTAKSTRRFNVTDGADRERRAMR